MGESKRKWLEFKKIVVYENKILLIRFNLWARLLHIDGFGLNVEINLGWLLQDKNCVERKKNKMF